MDSTTTRDFARIDRGVVDRAAEENFGANSPGERELAKDMENADIRDRGDGSGIRRVVEKFEEARKRA